MAEVWPADLPPAEAVEYFRGKGYEFSFDWEDVYAEEHARVFTVAKISQMDLLVDVRGAVDAAIADGIAPREFRKQLQPLLEEKGWWGRRSATDPRTGEDREVQLGSPRRLDVIYDTNLRTAHAAGFWQQAQRLKDRRPYLRMVVIRDDRTRPRHRVWHDIILPVDHPWWTTHYPPNGWRCRCSVQQLSQRDLDRLGLTVTESPPSSGTLPWENPRTGEIRQIPIGIDPGFDYNVGKAGAAARRQYLTDKLTDAAAQGAGDLSQAAVRQLVDSDDFAQFLARPEGDYPVMMIPDVVRQALRTRGHVAVLSAESALKNLENHPDIGIDDYRDLPNVGSSPLLIVQDRPNSAVIVSRAGKLLWTVVKGTKTGQGIFVTSVRRTGPDELEKLKGRKGAKVLLDDAEG